MSHSTIWHHATVTRDRRSRQNNHRSVVLWFSGLSGAGKSTLAHAVEEQLHLQGCKTFVMAGDNVRHGLSGDLGFSDADRKENLRRVGEVSKLFIEAGVIILAAFISPFREDREKVRGLVPHGDFLEIYVNCPLEVCESRDLKGLYKRARAGEITAFTGISSPYEPPEKAELSVDTERLTLEESVALVLQMLVERDILG